MKTLWKAILIAGSTLCSFVPVTYAGATKCTLKFDLHEWSVFYESAKGTGKITCDNGQSAKVTIRSKGGGLSVGKFKISNGRGSFTDVSGINQLFGKYVAADTNAGARSAADAWVMHKDKVSLGVAGTGQGWELGFSVDEFIITKQK